jgi:hypothetical protein
MRINLCDVEVPSGTPAIVHPNTNTSWCVFEQGVYRIGSNRGHVGPIVVETLPTGIKEQILSEFGIDISNFEGNLYYHGDTFWAPIEGEWLCYSKSRRVMRKPSTPDRIPLEVVQAHANRASKPGSV